jgi:hypothetical protein
MVQEEVEHRSLMVDIRNLARVSITSRAAGNIDKANELKDESVDLRDRAIHQIDSVISKTMPNYQGAGARAQVLASRLKAIRRRVNVDQFAAAVLAPTTEEPYYRLDPAQKRVFWLSRYNELVVAWYWPYRGIMAIQATLAHEPMTTYSNEEFVFVCDELWMTIIAIDVERDFLKQSGSVAERMQDLFVITAADEDRYRKRVGGFNILYNSKQAPTGKS